jgi:Family of unknown function (DUF695)
MNWVFYTGFDDDGTMVSHRLDLDLAVAAPLSEKPLCAEIWIAMHRPNPHGVSSLEEGDRFDIIEDALEQQLRTDANAIYAGLVTREGRWQFVYYMPESNVNLDAVVSCALQSLDAGCDFQAFCRVDRCWENYLEVLYPSRSKHREQVVNYKQWLLLKPMLPLIGREIIFDVAANESSSLPDASHFLSMRGYTIDARHSRSGRMEFLHASISWNGDLSELNRMTWELLDASKLSGSEYRGWRVRGLEVRRPQILWRT